MSRSTVIGLSSNRRITLPSSRGKLQEAAKLYISSANQFKRAKCPDRAGDAFLAAGGLFYKIGARNDAAFYYHEAAVQFKLAFDTVGPAVITKAINSYDLAIKTYVQNNQVNLAAKCHLALADIYKSEQFGARNVDKAMNCYQAAADYYSDLMQTTQSSKCMLHVAEYAAECGQYFKVSDCVT